MTEPFKFNRSKLIGHFLGNFFFFVFFFSSLRRRKAEQSNSKTIEKCFKKLIEYLVIWEVILLNRKTIMGMPRLDESRTINGHRVENDVVVEGEKMKEMEKKQRIERVLNNFVN